MWKIWRIRYFNGCAGTAIGGPIAEVDDKILRQSFEDNFSHQIVFEAIKIMKKQILMDVCYLTFQNNL